MKIPFLFRFLTFLTLASLAAVPSASAQLVHLDFADGGFANKGSLGGEAEDRQAAEGDKTGKIEVSQDSLSRKWSALFVMATNGTQGAHLAIPGSENALRLDKAEEEMSASFWIKWQGPDKHSNSAQTIITNVEIAEGGIQKGWSVDVLEDGKISFYWCRAASGGCRRSSKLEIQPGEWHHVAVTWSNANREGLRFYLDGQPVESDQKYTGGGPVAKSSAEILVGCGISYLPINGALADFRLYDRALDSDEISQLSQQGKP